MADARRSFPASGSGGIAPCIPVASTGPLPTNPHRIPLEIRGTAPRDAWPQAIRRALTGRIEFFLIVTLPVTWSHNGSGLAERIATRTCAGVSSSPSSFAVAFRGRREHGQFFFQVRLEVLEARRNDLRRREELALLRVDFRQIDLRAAIAKPRDAQRRGHSFWMRSNPPRFHGNGSEQLHEGERFLQVLLQRGLILVLRILFAGSTVHPRSSRNTFIRSRGSSMSGVHSAR